MATNKGSLKEAVNWDLIQAMLMGNKNISGYREADMHSPKEERLWLQSGKPASHKKAMDSIGVSMAVYCSSM
ncbi:hypothetical protein VIGAN_10095900 [Vigna angularis var. angularis]|uniref:Uncharacterized protein n=1 Tax=Vigna angularis var. angularis TaxID=157739 RepID=A0A0S3T334_PHAAN|nr:hypothetical protein VIGAN_10095900 [Vigna angularis var. angularis]